VSTAAAALEQAELPAQQPEPAAQSATEAERERGKSARRMEAPRPRPAQKYSIQTTAIQTWVPSFLRADIRQAVEVPSISIGSVV
jgi:hypothetical protein